MRGLAALLDKLRAASARCRRGGLALVRTMTDKGVAGSGASYGRFLFPAWSRFLKKDDCYTDDAQEGAERERLSDATVLFLVDR